MRIVVQSMDHYERLGGDCGGISSLRSDIPARLRRDFLGLRLRRTLTACRRGPCKPMAGSLSTAVLRHIFAAEPTLGKIAFSPGFRRYAPTSLPACGGAVQEAIKKPDQASLSGFSLPSCGEKGIRTLDTLLEYTRFPGVPLKPLEHLSEWDCKDNTFFHIFVCYE